MSTATDKPRLTRQDIVRGWQGRCPACGSGHIYKRYLRVIDHCPDCGEALHHQRADDFPAYIVVFLTGHIFVGLALELEFRFSPPFWVHALIWPPLAIAAILWLLPRVKGVIIAIQWRMKMYGFASASGNFLS